MARSRKNSGNRSVLLGSSVLFAVVANSCGPNTNAPEEICFEIMRDGKQVSLAVPSSLIPSKSERKGGNSFILNLGVDLKDFSSASSVPNVDDNLDRPDWSLDRYGYNPDLDIFSVRLEPEYWRDATEGKLVEIKSDVAGFRRYEACQDCGTDIYVPQRASTILLMRCYLPPSPTSSQNTGCVTDEVYGSAYLRYTIPYIVRQDPTKIETRVVALMQSFEKLGVEHCDRTTHR